MPLSADPPPRLKVGILWDADCIASNAAAVVDVLRTLQNLAAMRSPLAPVLAWEWLVLDASDIPCGGLPPAGGGGADGPHDVLVIPGTMAVSGPHLQEISLRQAQRARDVLRRHVGRGAPVAALFNGAALLAECGLLRGRELALPWAFAPSVLRMAGQGAQWRRDQPWHRDSGLWSTASLAHTVPAWLDLLAHTDVAELAQAAASVLEFDAQRQLTATAHVQTPTGEPTAAGALERARRWLQEHRNEPYSLAATARAAATSPRTLLRWFAQVHGQTPLDYLHGLRVAQAQALLQTTYLTVEAVAQQCGYGDVGSFRRIFARVAGVTPGAYRQRFRLRTSRRQWTGMPG